MEFDEVVDLLRGLDDTHVMIASAENGAPESSWGDAFASRTSAGGAHERFPFATVVLRDVAGFDEASRLDRPGVFRLNLGVGRAVLAERAEDGAAPDDLDRWVPHPVYAAQGWLSICSPAADRRDEILELAGAAHQRASARRRR